jgi:uncharacterized membrane protein (DUF4010 family)
MQNELLLRLGLSFIIGAIVGLEREYQHDEKGSKVKRAHSMGIRTYALISFLGGLCGYFASIANPLMWFVAGITGLMIVANYTLSSLKTGDYGPTSEYGAVATFFIGTLLFVPAFPLSLIFATTLLVTFLLSRKEEIKSITYSLHRAETNAFVMYGVIALVILPFLPNTWIRVGDLSLFVQLATAYNMPIAQFASIELLNPYRLWLVVTLITGIDLLGYLLQKILGGQKGWLLAAITGGFISSTASTLALAQRSKKTSRPIALVTAAILANTTSFVQMMLLVLPLNATFFTYSSLFFAVLLASGVVVSVILNLRAREGSQPIPSGTTVFSLHSALKFALIFSLIRSGSQVARQVFGESGVIITSAFGAIAGMDAIVITIADMAGKSLTFSNALIALVVANTVNLGTKILYAKTNGSPAFFRLFALSVCVIIAASIATLLGIF